MLNLAVQYGQFSSVIIKHVCKITSPCHLYSKCHKGQILLFFEKDVISTYEQLQFYEEERTNIKIDKIDGFSLMPLAASI